jgi:hypothetical protein
MTTLRSLFLALLLPYCGWLVGAYEYHLLDNVNLAIRETGNLLFTPFGQTMHMLGPLVGGGTHDWNWLLSEVGLVHPCGTIAMVLHVIACTMLGASFLAAGWLTLDERQPSPSGAP